MLSLWANWLQLNSQLNSSGVSFCLYRMHKLSEPIYCEQDNSSHSSPHLVQWVHSGWSLREMCVIAKSKHVQQVFKCAPSPFQFCKPIFLGQILALFNAHRGTKCDITAIYHYGKMVQFFLKQPKYMWSHRLLIIEEPGSKPLPEAWSKDLLFGTIKTTFKFHFQVCFCFQIPHYHFSNQYSLGLQRLRLKLFHDWFLIKEKREAQSG